MKTRRHLCMILLSSCLSQFLMMDATAIDTKPTNNNISTSMASKEELSAQKELFQLQLDAKKELLQKDIETQTKRIDAFEKRMDDQISRISDIGSSVDRFSVIVSFFGILITVLFVVAGFLGYRTAKSDAKETAKEAAEQAASKWFEDHLKNLNSRMEELERRATKASNAIDDYSNKVAHKSNEFNEKINALFEIQMENAQRQLSQSSAEGKPEDQLSKDNSAIEQKADQLKQKPESEYAFSDWNTRAFAVLSEGKLDDAIFYWDKAIAAPDIQAQTKAQLMFNKGIALGQLNRNEDAVATYEAIINEFGTAEELELRATVARSMFNKGVRLRKLNRNEEEIAAYDKVITEFDNTKEAIFIEPVTQAFNNKGFNLMCTAKANWENTSLAQNLLADAYYACSQCSTRNSDHGMAHGNLGYITWLQGDAVAAEQHFRRGLSSAINGGEKLYKDTLADFEIHPIAPDQGFRELVEKLWEEYQQSQRG